MRFSAGSSMGLDEARTSSTRLPITLGAALSCVHDEDQEQDRRALPGGHGLISLQLHAAANQDQIELTVSECLLLVLWVAYIALPLYIYTSGKGGVEDTMIVFASHGSIFNQVVDSSACKNIMRDILSLALLNSLARSFITLKKLISL